MAVPLSRDTNDLRMQLSAMPTDAKIGIDKCGVVVQFGGFDYHLHPQQSVRACNFILNRELSPKRMPSAWNRFATQIRAVFSGVKASRLLRALNGRAVQSVERLSVRSGFSGSALGTLHSLRSTRPFRFEGPANDDRLIDAAQAKLAAFRARNAQNQAGAPTLPIAVAPSPLGANAAANAVAKTNTFTQGSVRRNTHDAVTPSTPSSPSSRPPARPSIGVPPPNLVPPKPSNPSPVVAHNTNR
ncbi:hypothetical protein [Pandoraea commovens]|uniref:Uncharacterized protein n=1 Tax=Pandoraea commovens TaxID=2508289 RepID=A0A5E4U2R5_9BURK|nr:hypothetical protein [Pandoraea commovens]VVD93348.1 hypothetical protein PCO31010_01762 [Pandoraea commovens]